MLHGDDIVVKQSKIYVINGNLHAGGFYCGIIIFLLVYDLFNQNTGQFLLEHVIDGLLEVGIQGQINIISGLRFHMFGRFKDFADIIDKEDVLALFSLQILLHCFFDTGLSDGVIHIVFVRRFLKICKIFLGSSTGIAENMRKIFAFVIMPERCLFDIHTWQVRLVFKNDRDCLRTYIRSDHGG